jgi:hypothetical protein
MASASQHPAQHGPGAETKGQSCKFSGIRLDDSWSFSLWRYSPWRKGAQLLANAGTTGLGGGFSPPPPAGSVAHQTCSLGPRLFLVLTDELQFQGKNRGPTEQVRATLAHAPYPRGNRTWSIGMGHATASILFDREPGRDFEFIR